MNVLKHIAIYSALIAVILFAQETEFAGALYFMAAMLGMTLLNPQQKSEEDMEAVASY